MKPFSNFESRMVPLAINNIDTDQIIPARFLKTTTKQGLDRQLFCDWRYDAQGNPKPDFILNQPWAQGAQVLLFVFLAAVAAGTFLGGPLVDHSSASAP